MVTLNCRRCKKQFNVRPSKANSSLYCSRDCFNKSHRGENHQFFGKHHTEKTKTKISKNRKGKNVGRKPSEEERRKMSEGRKGMVFTEEHKANISKNNARIWLGKKLPEETVKKLSESKMGEKNPMFGKKQSEETIRKRSESLKKAHAEGRHKGMKGKVAWNKGIEYLAIRGEKHYNWKGDLATRNERRIAMSRVEYILWRTAVFERDNYTCVSCGARSKKGKKVVLHADHIKPWALYPELRYAIDNGRALCESCHRKTDTWGYKAIYRKERD